METFVCRRNYPNDCSLWGLIIGLWFAVYLTALLWVSFGCLEGIPPDDGESWWLFPSTRVPKLILQRGIPQHKTLAQKLGSSRGVTIEPSREFGFDPLRNHNSIQARLDCITKSRKKDKFPGSDNCGDNWSQYKMLKPFLHIAHLSADCFLVFCSCKLNGCSRYPIAKATIIILCKKQNI